MRALDDLAELLFPTRCAGCDRPGSLICDECLSALPLIAPEDACPRCGAPAIEACPECADSAIDTCPERSDSAVDTCPECADSGFAFSSARCLGVLDRPLSRIVTVYKDGGERRLAAELAALSAPVLHPLTEVDGVVAVPASRSAFARRGFDHAEGIADVLAALLDVPRLRPLDRPASRDQRRLGKTSRSANTREAFRPASAVAGGSRLLLIDDVMTTGATLDAAARVLLNAGASRVDVFAVARACRARRRLG